MAIANYADLQNAVANWLARTDIAAARVQEFITLFEAVANRRLRTRQMEASISLTPSSGAVALPADYLTWRRVTWTGQSRVELQYVHPSYIQAAYPTSPADVPRVFTIEGSTLKIRPLDSTPLEFDYWQQIPALATNTANWLLTAYPDLYLFGALVEASAFTLDLENGAFWKSRRDELFDEATLLDQKTRGPSAIRVMGQTP